MNDTTMRKLNGFMDKHSHLIDGLPDTWDELYDCAKKELNGNEMEMVFWWLNGKDIEEKVIKDKEVFIARRERIYIIEKTKCTGTDRYYRRRKKLDIGLETVRDFLLDGRVRIAVDYYFWKSPYPEVSGEIIIIDEGENEYEI